MNRRDTGDELASWLLRKFFIRFLRTTMRCYYGNERKSDC